MPTLTCVDLGRLCKAESVRSRNAGEAIHRVDFRHRVLVDRPVSTVLSRETEDAAKQLVVDAPGSRTSGDRVPGRSTGGQKRH